MSTRGGRDWIRTASGGRFYPLDPRPREISIEDVAHALSNLCRFTGHVREFYSVAQHCVLVSRWVEEVAILGGASDEEARALALEALLHDATEAYLNDVSTPVKRQADLAGYRAAEERLRLAIVERFGLPREESPLVKEGDRALLVAEARDLLPGGTEGFEAYVPSVEWSVRPIWPMSPKLARAAFLGRYQELTR